MSIPLSSFAQYIGNAPYTVNGTGPLGVGLGTFRGGQKVDCFQYEGFLARLGGYPGSVHMGGCSRDGPLGGACCTKGSFVLSGARRGHVYRRAVASKGTGGRVPL